MEHLTLKAVTTPTTDQGVFEAVISTESVDREKDVVVAEAMVDALKKWNRPIPLSWNHSTEAEDIFGSIEPMTVREENGEVVAQGQVDMDSKVGQEAWRSFKNRTVGFSFGYLTLKSSSRDGGGRTLTELDIFEITATPTPMNNDTRVLSTKSLPDDIEVIVFPDGVESKAVWTAAFINDLPDSAFLYIESGGDKDEEGKTTPRSLRHFPYKDMEGNVDLPHLRNALSRIPQSNLPQDVKDRLTTRAQRILDNAKAIEDAIDEEPPEAKSQAQDPLTTDHRHVFEVLTEGIETSEPPQVKQEPPPEIASLRDLERQYHDLMLETLI